MRITAICTVRTPHHTNWKWYFPNNLWVKKCFRTRRVPFHNAFVFFFLAPALAPLPLCHSQELILLYPIIMPLSTSRSTFAHNALRTNNTLVCVCVLVSVSVWFMVRYIWMWNSRVGDIIIICLNRNSGLLRSYALLRFPPHLLLQFFVVSCASIFNIQILCGDVDMCRWWYCFARKILTKCYDEHWTLWKGFCAYAKLLLLLP